MDNEELLKEIKNRLASGEMDKASLREILLDDLEPQEILTPPVEEGRKLPFFSITRLLYIIGGIFIHNFKVRDFPASVNSGGFISYLRPD